MKKIFLTFNTFLLGMMTKIYAFENIGLNLNYQNAPQELSIEEEVAIQELYNNAIVVEEIPEEIKIFKLLIPLIMLVIGIRVLLNKKLSKKVKAIIITILTIILIGFYFVMKYIENNL